MNQLLDACLSFDDNSLSPSRAYTICSCSQECLSGDQCTVVDEGTFSWTCDDGRNKPMDGGNCDGLGISGSGNDEDDEDDENHGNQDDHNDHNDDDDDYEDDDDGSNNNNNNVGGFGDETGNSHSYNGSSGSTSNGDTQVNISVSSLKHLPTHEMVYVTPRHTTPRRCAPRPRSERHHATQHGAPQRLPGDNGRVLYVLIARRDSAVCPPRYALQLGTHARRAARTVPLVRAAVHAARRKVRHEGGRGVVGCACTSWVVRGVHKSWSAVVFHF